MTTAPYVILSESEESVLPSPVDSYGSKMSHYWGRLGLQPCKEAA
jgi:hypothetical protein